MDPITALAIGSAVVGGASAIAGGNARAGQFQAQAQANAYNAAVLKQQADQTEAAFGAKEDQQRRFADFQKGSRTASLIQSGTGTEGSNADVERQSETLAELDALNIRYEGAMTARGLRSDSTLQSYYGDINRHNASDARTGGYLSAASSILSAGSAYYGRSLNSRNPGGP